MGLLGLYQDVLIPKEFIPDGVQLTKKLELFLSTEQRLKVVFTFLCPMMFIWTLEGIRFPA